MSDPLDDKPPVDADDDILEPVLPGLPSGAASGPADVGAGAGLAPGTVLVLAVGDDAVGVRLDQFVVRHAGGLSRSAVARAIDAGAVRVDGVVSKASLALKAGMIVAYTAPEPARTGPDAEEIALEFLFLDEAMAAVNKPAGMVVHPAKGNWKGTLAGALRWHLERGPAAGGAPGTPGLSTVGGPTRPGIVHRLDRDTSGVIVVARSEEAHQALARQFEQRSTEKTYLAVVQGEPRFDRDEINLPIGIHPYQRERMAVRRDHSTSRDAVTRYEVLERFGRAALLKVMPKTGRTHQIRVHLAAIGSPILADILYSGRGVVDRSFLGLRGDTAPLLRRQALHAASLAIDHPLSKERCVFTAPLPDDILTLLAVLRRGG